ncbi:MAG: hypothetical protein WC940_03045 [Candidatus Paceibacterota bacterium]
MQTKLIILEEKLNTINNQLKKLEEEREQLTDEIKTVREMLPLKEQQIYCDDDGENKFYYVINTIYETDLEITLYSFVQAEQQFTVSRLTSHICNVDFTKMLLTNQEELTKFIQDSLNYFNINQKEK